MSINLIKICDSEVVDCKFRLIKFLQEQLLNYCSDTLGNRALTKKNCPSRCIVDSCKVKHKLYCSNIIHENRIKSDIEYN